MNKPILILSLILAGTLTGSTSRVAQRAGGQAEMWTTTFGVAAGELGPTGRSPYVVLEPGYQLVLENGAERLVVTSLAETRIVDGVETRVVEERETKSGQLVEVSRNYFAISKRTNSVFYFGEDVDMYKAGRVVSHEGAWHAGEKNFRFGLYVPGQPLLGARYYQEIAPGVAMDRAEIVKLDAVVSTPAGTFRDCLETEETTPLEPEAKEYKRYAPGIGLVQDGELKLKSRVRSPESRVQSPESRVRSLHGR